MALAIKHTNCTNFEIFK
uniref:Uncharacterized protein n=1 Tax=Anguilla anguilla TaxID=7936 RepID=A0A0E9VMB0_ANGAN